MFYKHRERGRGNKKSDLPIEDDDLVFGGVVLVRLFLLTKNSVVVSSSQSRTFCTLFLAVVHSPWLC